MSSIFLLIIFLLALGYVLEPVFRKSVADDSPLQDQDRANLEIKKKLLIEGLKDLELDHQSKKMEEGAYQEMRREMIREGAHVVEELDSLERRAK